MMRRRLPLVALTALTAALILSGSFLAGAPKHSVTLRADLVSVSTDPDAGLSTDYHFFSLPPLQPPPLLLGSTTLRGSSRAYTFISTANSKPVRWNPCTVIGYRINPTGMTSADILEVRAAFRRISDASGLPYVYRGTTRWYYDRYGRTGPQPSDAPLVFAFVQKSSTQPYAPTEFSNNSLLGLGGPAWDSHGRIRRGMVMINRPAATMLPTGTGKGTRMQLYVHEIGHASGLDHVSARDQLMYPYFNRSLPPVLGAGDVTGLRKVGRPAGCLS